MQYEVVPESGCWIWTGAVTGSGYGVIYRDGEQKSAHRISYEVHNTELSKDDVVCHKCDIPCCVNPSHLFVGTALDNMQDMIKKGRGNKAKGSAAGPSKLDETQVLEIKRQLADGVYQRVVAERFGVKASTIGSINSGVSWSHVMLTNEVV